MISSGSSTGSGGTTPSAAALAGGKPANRNKAKIGIEIEIEKRVAARKREGFKSIISGQGVLKDAHGSRIVAPTQVN